MATNLMDGNTDSTSAIVNQPTNQSQPNNQSVQQTNPLTPNQSNTPNPLTPNTQISPSLNYSSMNKYAGVTVPSVTPAETISNNGVVDKANTIVDNKEAQNAAKTSVQASLDNPAQAAANANKNFVNGVIKAATGKDATQAQLNQYTNQPVLNVAKAFGFSPTQQTNTNLPGANDQNPASKNAPDPTITDQNTGLINLQNFQAQYMKDWQGIVDQIKTDQTNLANAKTAEATGVQGIGNQLGVEQGLLTGEEAAYKAQNDIAIQNLTEMLGIDQQAKADLTASGQFQMTVMNAANNLQQQAFTNAETLRSDQQTALTNFWATAKDANIDPTKLTPDQTTWINKMATATGIPIDTVMSGLKSIYATNILSQQQGALSTQQAQANLSKTNAEIANTKANTAKTYNDINAANTPSSELTTVDPASQSILSQTGLSIPAFSFLTQGSSALTRMTATQRLQYMKEAQDWANKNGIDLSTFTSQYSAYNDVLQKNISRSNQTTIFGGEVSGTADQFLTDIGNDFSKLKVGNVTKLFAGKQVNDSTVQKYAFDLRTMQNDLAGYYAASRGATSPDDSDLKAAESVITNGINSGSVQAFKDSINSNEKKVTGVVNKAVDSAQKQVWDLFGVGKNFKSKTPTFGGDLSSLNFKIQ